MTPTDPESTSARPGPDDDGSRQRGQVAGIVAGIMLALCVLLSVGLIGAVVLLVTEKGRSADLAAQMDADIAALESEIQAIEQNKRALVAEHEAVVAGLSADIDGLERKQARMESGEFLFEPVEPSNRTQGRGQADRIDPPAFPEPVATEGWDGRLRLEHEKPAVYTLPFQGLTKIKPYPRSLYRMVRTPVAFSEDGEKFFLIDGQSILYRYDAVTLKQEMKLVLGADCFDMKLTADGLALSFPVRNAIWMVDPATLTVFGSIALDNAAHIAATPASPDAYAIGVKELVRFDTAERRIDQTIDLGPDGVLPGVPNMLNTRIGTFLMHPDGASLFTSFGSTQALHRFAVLPDGIKYESSGRGTERGEYPAMSMSRDGRWLALTQAGLAGTRYLHNLTVYRTDGLEAAFVLNCRGNISAAGFDPANGRIYLAVSKDICVFASTGEREQTIERREYGTVIRIEPFPAGDRFLVWTDGGLSVWDMQPDRLAAVIPQQFHSTR